MLRNISVILVVLVIFTIAQSQIGGFTIGTNQFIDACVEGDACSVEEGLALFSNESFAGVPVSLIVRSEDLDSVKTLSVETKRTYTIAELDNSIHDVIYTWTQAANEFYGYEGESLNAISSNLASEDLDDISIIKWVEGEARGIITLVLRNDDEYAVRYLTARYAALDIRSASVFINDIFGTIGVVIEPCEEQYSERAFAICGTVADFGGFDMFQNQWSLYHRVGDGNMEHTSAWQKMGNRVYTRDLKQNGANNFYLAFVDNADGVRDRVLFISEE